MKRKFFAIVDFILAHKIPAIITAAVLCVAITATTVIVAINQPKASQEKPQQKPKPIVSSKPEEAESEPISSVEEIVSSEASSEKAPVSSAPKPKPAPAPSAPPAASGNYQYNSSNNFDNNVFLDALLYTGYNLKKQLADNPQWDYVLASQKRGKGWLSKITYGGGCTGYETDTAGKPNIARFERGGLVCASYVTYVYFNYLPNVAGLDTSFLPKPADPHLANSWYQAAQEWVRLGYSRNIGFTASKNHYIVFKPHEEIPIGSIVVLSPGNGPVSKHGGHVSIYAGKKNNYHWVTHVGNENGPEFCAIERMNCGPDPHWPLAIITPPANLRMSAMVEVSVKDEAGAPVEGVNVTLTRGSSNIGLGATNATGVVSKEGLSYGDCTISVSVPEAYTCASPSAAVKLTTANNSKNTVNITLTKKPVEVIPNDTPAEDSDSGSDDSQNGGDSSNESSESSDAPQE